MLTQEVREWLDNDNRHKALIVDTVYIKKALGGTTEEAPFRISNSPFMYDTGDTVRVYDETLLSISDIASQINSSTSGCTLKISNIDGIYDNILHHAWEGNQVYLYMVEECTDMLYTVFRGYINKMSTSSIDTIEMELVDNRQILENDIQNKVTDLFPDDHPIEQLRNTPKPLCYGRCFNISPVLIDTLDNVYQIHNGAIHLIIEVRENGSPLTSRDLPVGDDNYMPAGTDDYTIDFSAGTFTLLRGSLDSNGVITADVVGKSISYSNPFYFNDDVPIATMNSYSRDNPVRVDESCKITNIIRDIAQLCSLNVGDCICFNTEDTGYVGSFNTMQNETLNNGFISGIFIREKVSGYAIIEELLRGIGSYIYFDNIGLINIQQIKEPVVIAGIPILKITADEIKSNGIHISDIQPPIRKLSCKYKKNYTLQSKDSLAAELTESEMSVFTTDYLNTEEINQDFNAVGYEAYQNAESVDGILIPTVYQADAETETLRRLTLRSKKRFIYALKTVSTFPELTVGETIEITHERFGLEQGELGIIISSSINPLTRSGTLEVFM